MRLRPTLIVGLGLALLAPAASAQNSMDDVEIEATEVTPSIHMLKGAGGNLAVCVGADGAFLVDDQYAPLSDRIKAAIAKIHDGDVRFVINTHWHGDHTGGNENFGDAGSLIVAHDNVRARMAVENVSTLFDRTTPPSPEGALPVVTFNDEITFHLNGETIHAFHVPNAHTDGDAIIHFVDANVIHAGDVLFNRLFPFIDTDSGGSIDGMIAAVERILALCDADTRVIAGHGDIAGIDDMKDYLAMLTDLRAKIERRVDEGMDLDAVLESRPTAGYEEWNWGFIDEETFTSIVFGDLAGRAPSGE